MQHNPSVCPALVYVHGLQLAERWEVGWLLSLPLASPWVAKPKMTPPGVSILQMLCQAAVLWGKIPMGKVQLSYKSVFSLEWGTGGPKDENCGC